MNDPTNHEPPLPPEQPGQVPPTYQPPPSSQPVAPPAHQPAAPPAQPYQPPVQQPPAAAPPAQPYQPPVQQPPAAAPPAQPYQPPVQQPTQQYQQPYQQQGAVPAQGYTHQQSATPKKKTGLIVGGALAAMLIGGGGVAAVMAGGDDETAATTTTVAVTTTVVDDLDDTTTVPETALAPTVERLAQSTVQILTLDAEGNVTCTGSGTILDERGTILTNAHVITPNDFCQVESIVIAMTTDAGLPPEPLYTADLLNFDFELDLATLRIASSLDGSDLPGTFPTTEIGDSDQVTIGDGIRVLGYPAIGGSTITFTNGSVSGFTSQAGVSDRSWIKTDATIAGGNSGGTAVNAEGQLIGIPTQASAGDDAPIVDCRVITDTNGDGAVDGADTCTPIGGFLNGIRPVNLALPIIGDAETATPLPSNAAGEQVPVEVIVNTDDVIAYQPGFSLGIGETIEDTQFITTAAAGTQDLCFWFNWQNLPNGVIWDAVWLVDGEIVENFSYFGEPWVQETNGEDFWVCAQSEDGLIPGIYEIAFFVQDELIFVEAIEVTSEPVPVFTVEFQNLLDVPVCFLKVNPLGASDVGLDELGAEDIIHPGDSYTLQIPQGTIIATAQDCDGTVVSGSTDGITIVGDDVITIS